MLSLARSRNPHILKVSVGKNKHSREGCNYSDSWCCGVELLLENLIHWPRVSI